MTAIGFPSNGSKQSNPPLEEPDRVLLTAMALHELREPVHAAQGFLSVILQGRAGSLNEQQTDFLATADQALRRIGRRIEDVRLAVADRVPLHLDREPTDLIAHVHQCVQELRALAESYNVTLRVDMREQEGSSFICWADPGRLDQILLNILENAIRYAEAETTVTVFVRECSQDAAMAIIVRNFVDGDLSDTAQHWIRPFWRNEHQQQQSEPRMGLGLAIVDHLVCEHGGQVSAYAQNERVYVGVIFPRTNHELSSPESSPNSLIESRASGLAPPAISAS